eukprot:COSAG01_NODE_4207_length_5240_cov_6.615325_2_plen_84_part_00
MAADGICGLGGLAFVLRRSLGGSSTTPMQPPLWQRRRRRRRRTSHPQSSRWLRPSPSCGDCQLLRKPHSARCVGQPWQAKTWG